MQASTLSIPLVNAPFIPSVTIKEHESSGAYQILAEGPHICLSTFVGDYKNQIMNFFGEIPKGLEHEFEDMTQIFGDVKTRENYGNRQPQTNEQVRDRINFNAKRAIEGNPFTGFAAIEKTANKIIGFVSLGRGYEAGESQSGLILNTNFSNKGYGYEVVALASAIALVYAQNQFQVGSLLDKAPVFRFTATVLDSNEKGRCFLEKLGMKPIRALTEHESSEPRTLYGVTVKELDELLESKFGIQEINYEHITVKGQ